MDSLRENYKEFIKNNKLILKSQQVFWSENCNVFPKEVNNIVWNAKEDKIIPPINSIETYPYGSRKELVSNEEEIKCSNKIKQYKNNQFEWYYKGSHKIK